MVGSAVCYSRCFKGCPFKPVVWWPAPDCVGYGELLTVEACSSDAVVQHIASCPHEGGTLFSLGFTQGLPYQQDIIPAISDRRSGHVAFTNWI